jgi:hypothetical protein
MERAEQGFETEWIVLKHIRFPFFFLTSRRNLAVGSEQTASFAQEGEKGEPIVHNVGLTHTHLGQTAEHGGYLNSHHTGYLYNAGEDRCSSAKVRDEQ